MEVLVLVVLVEMNCKDIHYFEHDETVEHFHLIDLEVLKEDVHYLYHHFQTLNGLNQGYQVPITWKHQ